MVAQYNNNNQSMIMNRQQQQLQQNYSSAMGLHNVNMNNNNNMNNNDYPMSTSTPMYFTQGEDPRYYQFQQPETRHHHVIDDVDSDAAPDDHQEDEEETDNKRRHNATGNKSSKRKKKPTPDDPGFTALHHRRHFVRHNYHDHAHDKEECAIYPGASSGATGGTQADDYTSKGGVSMPFPLVLHNMLDAMENSDDAHIVSWQPHGRAFCVHDSKAFVSQVMPRWFRQSKISSFQRQLNLYGFSRLTSQGPDRSAYYNEYFLRGRPDLTVHMQRTRVKGTGVRTSSNPMEEPNFYEMEPVGGAKTRSNDDVTDRRSNKGNMQNVDTQSRPVFIPSSSPPPESNQNKMMQEQKRDNDCWQSRKPPTATGDTEMASSGQDPEIMDLEDVDVNDMALFLEDVDLTPTPPGSVESGGANKSTFGNFSVDLSHVRSTSV